MPYSYLNGLLAVHEKRTLGLNELRIFAESADRQTLRNKIDETALGDALVDNSLDDYPAVLNGYLRRTQLLLTSATPVKRLHELLALQLSDEEPLKLYARSLYLVKKLNSPLLREFLNYELDLKNLLIFLQLRQLRQVSSGGLFIPGGSLDARIWQALIDQKHPADLVKICARLQKNLAHALAGLDLSVLLRVEQVGRRAYFSLLAQARRSSDSAARAFAFFKTLVIIGHLTWAVVLANKHQLPPAYIKDELVF